MDSKAKAGRAQVSLKIKFKSETLEAFIERYAVDVSQGGIFIRTKEPQPVGTSMKFEFQLKDGVALLGGEGTVVWTREHDPSRPNAAPGMGVRFDKLADGSQDVLDKILAAKSKQVSTRAHAAETKPPEFNEVPTRVAPSPLVAALKGNAHDGPSSTDETARAPRSDEVTPLPAATPFGGGVPAAASPDAFSEATKIRSLDEIAAETGLDLGGGGTSNRHVVAAPNASDFGAQETRVQTLDELAKQTGPSGGDFGGQATRVQSLDDLMNAAKSGPNAGANQEIVEALGELSARRPSRDARPTPAHVNEEAAAALAAASVASEAEAARAAAAAEAAAPAPAEPAKAAEVAPPSVLSEPSRPRTPTREPRVLDATPAAKAASSTASSDASGKAAAAKEPAKVTTPVPAPASSGGSGGKIVAVVAVLGIAAAAVWYFGLRKPATSTPAPTVASGSATSPVPPPSAGSAAPGSAGPVGSGSDVALGSGSDAGGSGSDAVGSAATTAPTAPMVATTIGAATTGATVTVAGASGPAPFTTPLEKGKTYQAEVAAPGFLAKTIDVVGGVTPSKVKLEAKPRTVHVESTPAGAQIFVNGSNTKVVTPGDVTLTASQAKSAKVKIVTRLSGFADGSTLLAPADFTEAADRFSATVTATLRERKKDTGGGGGGGGGGGSGDAGGGDAGSGGSDAGSGTTTTSTATTEKPPEKPPEPEPVKPTEPTPDWANP